MKKKLIIVKVCAVGYNPSKEDVKHWADLFAGKSNQIRENENIDKFNLLANNTYIKKEIIEYTQGSEAEKIITLIKIGDEEYSPTVEDLEEWRNVFREAKNDTNFEIFTHYKVQLEQIKFED